MDALELLLSRDSALRLAAPGPDQAALEKILQSAVRSPDHGRLRPWRFVVIPEEARSRFGETLAWAPGRTGRAGTIVGLWMNSAPHRAVLMDGSLRRVGVGRWFGSMGAQRGVAVTADFSS